MEEKPVLRFCRICGKPLSASETGTVCKSCETKPLTFRPFRPIVEPAGRIVGATSFFLGAAAFITFMVKNVVLPLQESPWPITVGDFFLSWEVLLSAAILGILAFCIRGGRALGLAGFLFALVTFAHIVGWLHWLMPQA